MASAIPLSLYVHLPWCRSKCPYCDFNSYALDGAAPAREYVDALVADLEHDAPAAQGRALQTLFFGGGTPSLFPADEIARVIEAAQRLVGLSDGAEVTLEANPGTLESAPLPDFLSVGINRLSLGVQSFDDGCLQRLGRLHDSQTAIAAVEQARDCGFDNINLDLMYGLSEQSLAMAVNDVEKALALEPTHVSHYQLTLEPNTRFHANPPPLPDDEACWSMQQACQQSLSAAGLEQYEVSAYAKENRSCRHNVNYWQYGDYLAIGAGAHGKTTDDRGQVRRVVKSPHPRAYLAGPAGFGKIYSPSDDDRVFEFLLNALRLTAGFAWESFGERTGVQRVDVAQRIETAVSDGLLHESGGRCRATPLGHRFLNDLTLRFLPLRGAA